VILLELGVITVSSDRLGRPGYSAVLPARGIAGEVTEDPCRDYFVAYWRYFLGPGPGGSVQLCKDHAADSGLGGVIRY